MKREDLRTRIIPTTIKNPAKYRNTGNKKFNTTDLIYLDSYIEQYIKPYDGKKTNKQRRISATDYARMNNAYISDRYTTRTGKQTTWAWMRPGTELHVGTVDIEGDFRGEDLGNISGGLCPSLHYHLPSDISTRSALRFLKGQKNRNESEDNY